MSQDWEGGSCKLVGKRHWVRWKSQCRSLPLGISFVFGLVLVLFVFFSGAGAQTQDTMHTRQALCHCATDPLSLAWLVTTPSFYDFPLITDTSSTDWFTQTCSSGQNPSGSIYLAWLLLTSGFLSLQSKRFSHIDFCHRFGKATRCIIPRSTPCQERDHSLNFQIIFLWTLIHTVFCRVFKPPDLFYSLKTWGWLL